MTFRESLVYNYGALENKEKGQVERLKVGITKKETAN